MPKKKDKGYQDAMASVFDFIFTEAKKKKPRPIKYKPGQAQGGEFASALAEIAGKPALYATDEMMNFINGTFPGFKLIDIKTSVRGANDEDDLVLKVGGISSMVKDPKKFVDKAFDNVIAADKWKLVSGETMKGFDSAMAALWLSGKGLNASEALRFGLGANMETNAQMQAIAHQSMAQNSSVKAFGSAVSLAKAKKVGNHVDSLLKTGKLAKYRNLNNKKLDMSPEDLALFKADLVKYCAKEGIVLSDTQFNEIHSDLNNQYVGIASRSNASAIGELNAAEYRQIQRRNIDGEIAALLKSGDPKDRQKALKLSQARAAMEAWDISGKPDVNLKQMDDELDEVAKAIRANAADPAYVNQLKDLQASMEEAKKKYALKADIEKRKSFKEFCAQKEQRTRFNILQAQRQLDSEIATLRASGLTDAQINAHPNIVARRDAIDTLHSEQVAWRNYPRGTSWATDAWAAKGKWDFINANFIQGGAIKNIMSGDYFKQDRFDMFQGSDTGGVKIGNIGGLKLAKFNNSTGKYDISQTTDVAENKLWLASGSGATGTLATLATDLYYLTPSAMLKTILWNGQGFAYTAMKNQMYLQSLLTSPRYVKMLETIWASDPRMTAVFGPYDPKSIMNNYSAIIMELAKTKGGIWKAFNVMQKNGIERMAKLANLPHFKAFMLLNKKFGAFREATMKPFLDVLSKFGGKGWQGLVGQWGAGNIGIRQLVQKGVMLALQALGITFTGGLLNIAVTILGGVISDKIFMAFKPIFEVLIARLVGLVILIAMGLWWIGSLLSAHSYNPPKNTDWVDYDYYGSAGTIIDPVDPDLPPYELPPGTKIDGTCPFASGWMSCGQGDGPTSSSYHQKYRAVDLSGDPIWHAPEDGRVVSANKQNFCADGKDYGGAVTFAGNSGATYIILHVQPYVMSGSVGQGEPVAALQYGLPVSNCWTGPHYHLHLASRVPAKEWYEGLGCKIGNCPYD